MNKKIAVLICTLMEKRIMALSQNTIIDEVVFNGQASTVPTLNTEVCLDNHLLILLFQGFPIGVTEIKYSFLGREWTIKLSEKNDSDLQHLLTQQFAVGLFDPTLTSYCSYTTERNKTA